MPLATAYDVLKETGANYPDFNFDDEDTFSFWIDEKLIWVDNKVSDMVGSYYTDVTAIPNLTLGEIYWTYAELLRRRQNQLAANIEGGFAIGSLRIDSTAGPAERLTAIADNYFKKARLLIEPYVSLSGHKWKVVHDRHHHE